LFSTVRTLPGNTVARHAPNVFFHAVLTDIETASTSPAESVFSAAAMTRMCMFTASFSSVNALRGGIFHGCCLITLLVCILIEQNKITQHLFVMAAG
jgi:hypothetical protein